MRDPVGMLRESAYPLQRAARCGQRDLPFRWLSQLSLRRFPAWHQVEARLICQSREELEAALSLFQNAASLQVGRWPRRGRKDE